MNWAMLKCLIASFGGNLYGAGHEIHETKRSHYCYCWILLNIGNNNINIPCTWYSGSYCTIPINNELGNENMRTLSRVALPLYSNKGSMSIMKHIIPKIKHKCIHTFIEFTNTWYSENLWNAPFWTFHLLRFAFRVMMKDFVSVYIRNIHSCLDSTGFAHYKCHCSEGQIMVLAGKYQLFLCSTFCFKSSYPAMLTIQRLIQIIKWDG